MSQKKYLQISIDVPLRQLYHYLPGDEFNHVLFKPGMRVRVPFGNRTSEVGVIVNTVKETGLPDVKLKPVQNIIDNEPLLDTEHLKLLNWAIDYYQHPHGEVIFSAMPGPLRKGKLAEKTLEYIYTARSNLSAKDVESLGRARKQKLILQELMDTPDGLTEKEMRHKFGSVKPQLQSLLSNDLIHKSIYTQNKEHHPPELIRLNDEQKSCVDDICSNLHSFSSWLLYGITGSGKTEVYIEVIREVINQNKQALILVPEISLTPQLLYRLHNRLSATVAVLHSGLGDSIRLQNWLDARNGSAQVVIGTRSAVWTPLHNPGIIIVDEEHDPSFKQEEGFRYNARDVAIMRAKLSNIPVILGSATPSLESIQNVRVKKFRFTELKQRASGIHSPEHRIIDLRNQSIQGAFSKTLLQAIDANLQKGDQSLLFLNRRGFSPVLLCHHCGWIAGCERCSVNLTWHKTDNLLVCHHCDKRQSLPGECPECGTGQFVEIGYGTQRITQTLNQHFPAAKILRIDRDSTREKNAINSLLSQVDSGEADILVGTQMLAKGHDFPDITLVGIVDADNGLLSADFRATERMAQLLRQVSGRAGRATKPGTVYIQTHYPDHPLLQSMLNQDYYDFAEQLLVERETTNLPPFTYQALLRAEATDRQSIEKFLVDAKTSIMGINKKIETFGPYLSPIEKRQGRFRYQLLLQTVNRNTFRNTLPAWLHQLESSHRGKKVRWSFDMDPQEML